MLIYPVPAAVTQARVQLVADQTEKAPSHVIAEDVINVLRRQESGSARRTGGFKGGRYQGGRCEGLIARRDVRA